MDLLEVFLSQRIQPLQARDHSMWMYSGAGDTARVHPEEVPAKTVAQWLRGITGNKDNPRGARRVDPFSNSNQPTDYSWVIFLIIFEFDRFPLDFLSCRFIQRCTQCPMANKIWSRTMRARTTRRRVVTGSRRTTMMKTRATSQTTRR